MNERGLTSATIKHFKLGATENGDIAIPIFKNGILVNYKFRGVKEKKFTRFEGGETWCFNDAAFSVARINKKITICEGELDAISLWQMGIKSVVSLTSGVNAKNQEWTEEIPEEVEKIYVNFDNDEAGQRGAREFAERLGLEKCYNVKFDKVKDANEFLTSGGKVEEVVELHKNAKRFNPEGILQISELVDKLKEGPTSKLTGPLDRFNKVTDGGVVKGGMITIIARPGTGKTSYLLNCLLHHADQGIPVLLISLEDETVWTVQKILESKLGKLIKNYNEEDYQKAKEELANYPFYINHSKDITTILQFEKAVLQAKKLYGIEVVGYDHVNMMTTRKEELAEVARQFHEAKNKAGVTLYLVSHVRKGLPGNNVVTSDDVYGTAAFHQLSNMVLVLNNYKKGMYLTIDKSRESPSYLSLPVIFRVTDKKFVDDMSRKIKRFDEEIDDNAPLTPYYVPPKTEVEPERQRAEVNYEDVDVGI